VGQGRHVGSALQVCYPEFKPWYTKKKKKKNGAESGGTDLHSQLLGRQRQKNQEFKASLSKVKETLSQNQPTK
jgi:hypothetical protein